MNKPIGVFDSGIGGLTVFAALRRRMPREKLIYFGDTAHLPYGSKSKETVTRYSLEIARFLVARGVKALVIACNTSSALALPEIKKALKIPVLGVIGPGARAAAAATRGGPIGIIGTEATIASQAYSLALKEYLPGVKSLGAACPLFVPLVEEGWWSHPVTRAVAREYLKPLKRAGSDTLILGCTHYPCLKPLLQKVMGPKVRLIDSAEETARETSELLKRLGIERKTGAGSAEFIVSDSPERFHKLAQRLLGVSTAKAAVHRFE